MEVEKDKFHIMRENLFFVGAIHESPVQRGLKPMGGGRIVMRPYDDVEVNSKIIIFDTQCVSFCGFLYDML